MIPRPRHVTRVRERLDLVPVVAILGARQVGKTTLSREIERAWHEPVVRYDLEDPTDLARLADPKLALESHRGLVIIDEIQRLPDLFPLLRVLVDRPDSPCHFLVLGSASPSLLRQTSESLAGRISHVVLPGFSISEIGESGQDDLWVRGTFPRSYLARDDEASYRWRLDFIRTFLERDLPQLGSRLPAETLRRFWTMLAHNQGQVWNGSRLASSLGLAHTTVRSYLDILSDTFMARPLSPFLPNIGKRLVKSPKVYLRDSGLVHALLNIGNRQALLGHPVVGASWEGFAMEQVMLQLDVEPEQCFFWATHNGAELDLVVEKHGARRGYEFKRTSAPRTTRSMRIALDVLDLESISVVYPGKVSFPMADRIMAVPLTDICPPC